MRYNYTENATGLKGEQDLINRQMKIGKEVTKLYKLLDSTKPLPRPYKEIIKRIETLTDKQHEIMGKIDLYRKQRGISKYY